MARVDPPKVTKRDPVLLSGDELERLLEACGENDMLRLWFLLLAESGVRSQSEALHLRWEDLHVPAGFLWIDSQRHGRRTKSGKGRWCPVTPRLTEALRDHMATYRLRTYGRAGQRSPWVFHYTLTARKAVAGERIRSMREAAEKARTAARLPEGFVFHDLRHRRVTSWLAEGRTSCS